VLLSIDDWVPIDDWFRSTTGMLGDLAQPIDR
jgi:hypothetical protein